VDEAGRGSEGGGAFVPESAEMREERGGGEGEWADRGETAGAMGGTSVACRRCLKSGSSARR